MLIEFAINDADTRNQISLDESKQNVVEIIKTALDYGTESVWLMTTHQPAGRHRRIRPNLNDYYRMYRQLGDSLGIGVIDLNAIWGQDSPDAMYMPDGIHPNQNASRDVIAPAVISAIRL